MAVYIGETNRNLTTRGEEHLSKYMKGDGKSFMFEHQCTKHNMEPASFEFKVRKTFKDPLSRQTYEAVAIRREEGEILNSKSEFYQPPLVQVRSEIQRGMGI